MFFSSFFFFYVFHKLLQQVFLACWMFPLWKKFLISEWSYWKKEALYKGHVFKRVAMPFQLFMQRFLEIFIIQKIWNTVKYIEYIKGSHWRVLNPLAYSVAPLSFLLPQFSCLLKGLMLFISFYKVIWGCHEHTKPTKSADPDKNPNPKIY